MQGQEVLRRALSMSTPGDKTVIVPSPTNGQQVSIFFPTPLRVLQTPLTCIGPHKEKASIFHCWQFFSQHWKVQLYQNMVCRGKKSQVVPCEELLNDVSLGSPWCHFSTQRQAKRRTEKKRKLLSLWTRRNYWVMKKWIRCGLGFGKTCHRLFFLTKYQ